MIEKISNNKKRIKNLILIVKILILFFSIFYFVDNFPFSAVETPYENF